MGHLSLLKLLIVLINYSLFTPYLTNFILL